MHALRMTSIGRGGGMSIKQFVELTGIPESQIYRQFARWGDVCVAAGLKQHSRSKRWYSDDELLAEFHRVTTVLNRLPTWHEFTRLRRMNFQVLYRRFGSRDDTICRYRRWLAERMDEWREPGEELPDDGAAAEPIEADGAADYRGTTADCAKNEVRDVRWMERKWGAMRVVFAPAHKRLRVQASRSARFASGAAARQTSLPCARDRAGRSAAGGGRTGECMVGPRPSHSTQRTGRCRIAAGKRQSTAVEIRPLQASTPPTGSREPKSHQRCRAAEEQH